MEAGDSSLKSRTVTRGWKKAFCKAQITRWGIQIHSPHNSIHQGVSFICSNFQRLKPPPLWWMKCFREVSSMLHWGHCIPFCSLCLFHHLSFLSVFFLCLADPKIRKHYTPGSGDTMKTCYVGIASQSFLVILDYTKATGQPKQHWKNADVSETIYIDWLRWCFTLHK